MEGRLKINGTKEDTMKIIDRLLNKYGKDARLIDVMFKEYGCLEVNLYWWEIIWIILKLNLVYAKDVEKDTLEEGKVDIVRNVISQMAEIQKDWKN